MQGPSAWPKPMKRALVFFPFFPYPIRDGAQARNASVVQGLHALGYEVTLLVSTVPRREQPSQDLIREAERGLGVRLHVHVPGPGDFSVVAGIGLEYDTGWEGYTPPTLFRAFRSLARSLSPDVVLVNYGYWATLAQGLEPAESVRLVDMIDLVSLHVAMNMALSQVLPARPVNPRQVPAVALREEFFRARGLEPSAQEFAAYEAFDGTIAISPLEAALVEAHTSRTSVSHIPMSVAPSSPVNTYDATPVYVMSDTLLNQQGYAYFAQRVLPLVRAREPRFSVRVVGTGCSAVTPVDGIELVGPVETLADVYTTARFAVCPLIGGTGQQVKVVEAMAHGLPVVALDDLADRSPIVDNVNGLRARDAEAFASACVRLWTDPQLARRLGDAARATVRDAFNPSRVPDLLAGAIERARLRARERMTRPEPPAGPLRRFLSESDDWPLGGRRVAIYGAGSLGRACRTHINSSANVITFVDSDPAKDGTQVEGVPVIYPERLPDVDVDLVVVASMYWPQILTHLETRGWTGTRVRVF